MKHIFTFCLLAIVLLIALCTTNVWAQVSTYTFGSSSGTYTEISGGTVLGTTSNDDNSFTGIPIGFSFSYNGTSYDTMSVQTNGFVALGRTVSSSYTAISSGSTNNIVVAFNKDLESRTDGELSYILEGSVGSQILTVQWKNYQRYISGTADNGDIFNFQIKLYEGTNVADVVYGSYTINLASSVQVGLRGASSSDFNNRSVISGSSTWSTSTAGGANTATCVYDTVGLIPASGLTYTWTPTAQVYTSSTTTQDTTSVLRGTTNAKIIGIEVVMTGSASPLNATLVNLNTTGTTSTADISNARLYYTGTTGTFATTNQFGSTVASPSGAFSFSATQALAGGTNYFWLTYDIQSSATAGDLADAQCTSITVGGTPRTPSVTAPAGARTITAPPTTFNEDFATYTGIAPPPISWNEGNDKNILDGTSFGSPSDASWTVDGFGNVGTTGAARFNLFGSGSTDYDWLLSPTINLNIGGGASRLVYDIALTPYSTTVSTTMDANDTVYVVVSTDGGSTFPRANVVATYNAGTPISNTGQTEFISLAAYSAASSVRIGFYVVDLAGAGDYNFYIDNARVEPLNANDIQSLSLDVPANGGMLGQSTAFTPKATFKNNGTANQVSPFNVKYEILNSVPSVVYTNTQSIASLVSGATAQVTFSAVGAGLSVGSYSIRATALLGTDGNRGNDTLRGTITVVPVYSSFPYFNNFDGVSDSNWTSAIIGGTVNQWVRGTPVKELQIDAAHSGTKCWITRLDSSYAISQNAALISPLFNFASLSGNPKIEFWHNFKTEGGFDAGVLEYTSNGGSSWFRMDSTLGTGPNFTTANSNNWYNSSSTSGTMTQPKWSGTSTAFAGHDSGWIKSTTSLAGLTGQTAVQFRWRFVSDGSVNYEGWAIDDVTISNALVKDIQVSSVILSPGNPTVGLPITVKAVIRNLGSEANPASVPLTYKVGAVPASSGDGTAQTFAPTWTGNSDTVSFTTTYTPPATGSLLIGVRSFYAGDLDGSNDSAKTTTTVFPAGTLFSEAFTSATFPPTGWTTSSGWSRQAATEQDGSAGFAARCNFYSITSGVRDTLKTPVLDLSSLVELASAKILTFDHAYRTYTGGESDSMRVIISSDGGATWGAVLFNDGAPNLATLPPDGSGYIPTAGSDWRANLLSIPAAYLNATCRIAFVGLSDFGNNFWLDNVVVRTLSDTDYVFQSLAQENGIPNPFRPIVMRHKVEKNNGGVTFVRGNGVASTPSINNSKLLANQAIGSKLNAVVADENFLNGKTPVVLDGLDANVPVTLKGVVKNIGVTAPPYQVSWTFDGASQTPVSRGGIASLGVDTVTLGLTPLQRGTFTTSASIVLPGDKNTGNNSKTTLRTLVYPDASIRLKNDNGGNIADTYIGYNSLTSEVEAGVRFTAAQDMKLANIDAYYRNETNADSVQVKVYAAGASDSSTGTLLYTKKFGGANYISSGGDYMTLPLGNDAPTIASGTTFWVSILFPQGILFPMGAHIGPLATSGHSFISADSGATWESLYISPDEYAWLLRVVGVAAGSNVTVSVGIAQGWNLISNPVTVGANADSVKLLYPTSSFNYAFAFNPGSGYAQSATLTNGRGYWAKFPAAVTNLISGVARTRDSVSVLAGWNILGSISNPVDTSTIVSVPTGLRASNWFGYSSGYSAVTQLTPGKAYWIKSSGAGKFVLANPLLTVAAGAQPVAGDGIEGLNTVTVADSKGGSQTLYVGVDTKHAIPVAMYAMPPAPPAGAFDARFESVEGGLMVQTHGDAVESAVEFPIAIQSDAYPLTVSWKMNGAASYELADGMGEKAFAHQSISGEGSMKIANRAVTRIVLRLVSTNSLPTEFALSQNYPNPFNPTTSIKFALPVQSQVTMEIYNVLGQRVRTLLREDRAAGYQVVEWNGTGNAGQQLGSGVYFLQLVAKGTNGKSFNEVRKLMMLK